MTHEPTISVSDVLTSYLSAVGIKHVFGYPGDPNVELIESLRQGGVEFVLARREGTAAFMAEAYGQLTGRPGVCISTLGPGSSNLINGVANALLDRVPMIAISGQIEGRRAATFTHQVLNHAQLFGPITKWLGEVRPDNVAKVMRKALRTAVAERPGPVHLTTPADVVGAPATDHAVTPPPMATDYQGVQVFTTKGRLADPLVALRAAAKPVIVAGIGAARADAQRSLVGLAESAGIPVVVAPMAKGVFPEDHPLFAGVLDMACNAFVWDFLEQSDLIVAVGFDAVELIKPWSPTAPVIHIDVVPNTDQIYPAEIEIVGPFAAILDELAAGSSDSGSKWTETAVREHRQRLFELYGGGRVTGVLNPTDVVRLVREAMPRNAVASVDVGSHKLLVGQGWQTYDTRSFLMTNGLSSMGYSLPAAIAAAHIGDRPVVCFVGDGGFAMVQGELQLAATLGVALRVVVFCDNSLNRIELKQTARGYPACGTRIDMSDVAAIARAQGCEGVTVRNSAELEKALSEPPPHDRPLVIAAIIDPSQYEAQF